MNLQLSSGVSMVLEVMDSSTFTIMCSMTTSRMTVSGRSYCTKAATSTVNRIVAVPKMANAIIRAMKAALQKVCVETHSVTLPIVTALTSTIRVTPTSIHQNFLGQPLHLMI